MDRRFKGPGLVSGFRFGPQYLVMSHIGFGWFGVDVSIRYMGSSVLV